jgi:hypothetical protein
MVADIVAPPNFMIPHHFDGVLDGNGHTLFLDFDIELDTSQSRPLYRHGIGGTQFGFFNRIERNGTVKNLNVQAWVRASLQTEGYATFRGVVGIIAGSSIGLIENVHVTGGIQLQGGAAGGLVGVLGGTVENPQAIIRNSSFNGSMSAERGRLAGIVVDNRGTVADSYVNALLTTQAGTVGGIAAANDRLGTIENSHVVGHISGTGERVGGIAGTNHSGIRGSTFDGSVTTDWRGFDAGRDRSISGRGPGNE